MTRSNELEIKIRTYLSSLSPKALGSLVRNLENSKRKESSDPHLDLILTAAAALGSKAATERDRGTERGAEARAGAQTIFLAA